MDNCPHNIEASGSEQEANLNVMKTGLAADHPGCLVLWKLEQGTQEVGKPAQETARLFLDPGI